MNGCNREKPSPTDFRNNFMFLYNLRMITATLRKNKRRTFLTMLGIIIGVAAVIFINSAGAGAQSLVINQIKGIGSNLIGILPGGGEDNGPPASVMGIVITTLTYEDAQILAQKIPAIQAVAAYVRGSGTISWQSQNADASFTGVTASYPQVENAIIGQGHFFSVDEEKDLSRVVVLGSQIAKDLFGDNEPLGQTVRLKKESFRVIGVLQPRGAAAFQSYDGEAFVPLATAQKLLLGIRHVSYIRAKVSNENEIPATVEQIKQLLRERHNIKNPAEDDFSVRNQAQALQVFGTVTDALRLFMTAIAALGLVVGGVGIMNIMLVTVQERVREIGLRKAVGATAGQIGRQFLSETVALASAAGLIGIFVGSLLAIVAAIIVRHLGYDWDLVISWQSILASVGISVLVGLIFGLYPARRAAELNPIEALHYE